MAAEEGEGEARSAPVEDAGDRTRGHADELRQALQVRQALQDEAEDARRRVLGPSGRPREPAPPSTAVPDVEGEEGDALRRLIEVAEEETARLGEQAAEVRLDVERAVASLREQASLALERLAAGTAEQTARE